jgi:hypothetical protein
MNAVLKEKFKENKSPVPYTPTRMTKRKTAVLA